MQSLQQRALSNVAVSDMEHRLNLSNGDVSPNASKGSPLCVRPPALNAAAWSPEGASPEAYSPSPVGSQSVTSATRAGRTHNPYGGWQVLPDENSPMANAPRGSPYMARSKEMRVQRQLSASFHSALASPIMPQATMSPLLPSPFAAAMAQGFHSAPVTPLVRHNSMTLPTPTPTFEDHAMDSHASVPNDSLALPPPEVEDDVEAILNQERVCCCLIQFKCHQAEYSSPMVLTKGQYVIVQGDRGNDLGVVIRVNKDGEKSYVERSGPTGSVLRVAKQAEVDYWRGPLKAEENACLEFARSRSTRQDIQMEIRSAEYQFDKKKLTFYYDSRVRVDFVSLCKELYREYGCRIWMEKVRNLHE